MRRRAAGAGRGAAQRLPARAAQIEAKLDPWGRALFDAAFGTVEGTNVYRNLLVHREFEKAQRIITELYGYFLEHGLVKRAGDDWTIAEGDRDWADDKTAHRHVCDYIAGMTDNYAISVYEHLYMPSPWSVR